MTLREVLGAAARDAPPVEVTGLAYDNRLVAPGTLFFCVPGFTRDGHDFAPDAVARGAAALVVERPLGLGVPEVVVEDVRAALARLKPEVALYVGGMGHKDKNFHKDMMTSRGFGEAAARIQELYLAGRKEEAAAAVPDELVAETAIIGTAEQVRAQVKQWADRGVTMLMVSPRTVEEVRTIAAVLADN